MEAAVEEKVQKVCPTGLKSSDTMLLINNLTIRNKKTRTLMFRKS